MIWTRSILALLLLSSGPAFATTFYVAANGKDANPGTSQARPWKTVARANQAMATLRPGDSVLFRRGDIFRDDYVRCLNLVKATTETTLQTNPPTCSGSPTAPITIGAYGTGAAPIFDAADPIVFTWTNIPGTSVYSATVHGTLPGKLFVDSATTPSAQLLPVPNARGSYDPAATYSQFDEVTNDAKLYVRGAGVPTRGVAPNSRTWVNVLNTAANNRSQTFSPTATGLDNVKTIAGSWWSDSSTLYVHLAGDANPTTHAFEGTFRPYGVLLEGVNNVTVTGLAVEHTQESAIASIPYPSDHGAYFTGENIHLIGNTVWNYGGIIPDALPLQDHTNGDVAGLLIRADGQPSPHLVRGALIQSNKVLICDAYFALRGTVFQAGIIAAGIDGNAPANNVVIADNFVSTINALGIVYNMLDLPSPKDNELLNNGGRVTHNELTNNHGNIFFTATRGGMVDHNTIHESYGEGVQSGGHSLSTPDNPQTFAFNLIYHLARSGSEILFNGFDCNGNNPGSYWLNNTVYDANSAAITLEGGCSGAHVHNNIFDQNSTFFPAFEPGKINHSYLFYNVTQFAHDGADFSNNLWLPGSNEQPFHGNDPKFRFTCATFFDAWPDKNSKCADPLFVDPAHNDFHLRADSPARHAGTDGQDLGALPFKP